MHSFIVTLDQPLGPIRLLLFARTQQEIEDRLKQDLPNVTYSITQR